MLAIALMPPALLGSSAAAQDDGKPTIAFLYCLSSLSNDLALKGFLNVMQAYGFINSVERVALNEEEDLEGEKLSVFRGDAGGDLPTANLLVNPGHVAGAKSHTPRDLTVPLALPQKTLATRLSETDGI